MYGSAGSIILELAVVGLLAAGIIRGVRKGFFKSLMDLLILAVAIFAAIQVCRWTTETLVNRLYPKAEERVLKALESAETDLADVDLEEMKFDEDHPDNLTDLEYAMLKRNAGIEKIAAAMEKAGIPQNRIRVIIAKTLKKANSSSTNLNDVLTDSAKAATRKGLTIAVQVITFLLVLIIVLILLQLLTNGIRKLLWQVDIIKTLDRFLGFLTGALIMLTLIFIVLYLFKRLGYASFEEKLGQTLFAAFLDSNNPLTLFFD